MTFPWFLGLGGAVILLTLAAMWLLRDRPQAVFAGLVGGFSIFILEAFAYFRFRVDDAYITFRYARNLAAGAGPVWNPGERVEGYTSFSWMLLLALMHLAHIDIELAAVILACASMAALFYLIWRVWLRLSPDAGRLPLPPHAVMAAAGILVAANTGTGQWSLSGLETPLAAALIMAVILTYQRESREPGIPWSAVVLSAGVMTRPEMAFIAALTAAFFFDQAVTDPSARRWRHLGAFVLIFVALAGTWFAWRWSYYGYFFPNTYYDKVGPTGLMLWRGWLYMSQYWWSYLIAPSLIASVILPFLLEGQRRRDAAFICALSAVWLFDVVLEGGDVFGFARFVVPVFAPLYIALFFTLGIAVSRATLPVPSRAMLRSAAFGALTLAAAITVAWSAQTTNFMTANRTVMAQWKVEGIWIRDNAPPDYLTAVLAAGIAPYYSGRPTLDMLGLTDTTIAHTHVPYLGEGYPGHERYNNDYVLTVRRPQIILSGYVAGKPATGEDIRESETADRGLVPAVNELVHDPRTWDLYEMAAFDHDGLWYSFLVRKDIASTLPLDWTESSGYRAQPTATR